MKKICTWLWKLGFLTLLALTSEVEPAAQLDWAPDTEIIINDCTNAGQRLVQAVQAYPGRGGSSAIRVNCVNVSLAGVNFTRAVEWPRGNHSHLLIAGSSSEWTLFDAAMQYGKLVQGPWQHACTQLLLQGPILLPLQSAELCMTLPTA